MAGLSQDVGRLERLQAAQRDFDQGYAEKQIATLARAFKALCEERVRFAGGTVEGKRYDIATDFGEALKTAFSASFDDAVGNMGCPQATMVELPGI